MPRTTESGERGSDLDWSKLIQAAGRSFADPAFDERERKYKLAIAARLQEIMRASQSGSEWVSSLRRALSSEKFYNHRYNLTSHFDHSWLLDLDETQVEAVADAFGKYLLLDNPVERLAVWSDTVAKHAPEKHRRRGSIVALGSVFNFALDLERLPIVKAAPFGDAEREVGFELEEADATHTYAQHLVFAELANEALREVGIPIRDMLDVQSVIWGFHDAKELARKIKGVAPPAEPLSRRKGWIRDELILAMDLLQRSGPDPTAADVQELVETLRKLPIEGELARSDAFRGQEEVRQVLAELEDARQNPCDPDEEPVGEIQRVVEDFRTAPEQLEVIAGRIRALSKSEAGPGAFNPDPAISEAAEGRVLTATHSYRERNRGLAEEKKRLVVETYGKLACEGCGFIFADRYGDRGTGFIECHHLVPVSELQEGDTTTLDDLALVCSNCHRMIHRRQPWLSMDELKELLAEKNS